jgi:3-phytase
MGIQMGDRLFRFVTICGLFCCAAACATPRVASLPAVPVQAAGETAAVATANADAADDPAIWAAPPGRTVRIGGGAHAGFIAGTDKKAGLNIYGLDGAQLQFLPDGLLNNVDLREGVVGGRVQVVLGASDRGRMGVALYAFDPAATDPANAVRPYGFIKSDVIEPYGFCMGRWNDALHAVLVAKDGAVRVYQLALGAQAAGIEIARFKVATQPEGCAVDEAASTLYVGEELRGLWRYSLSDFTSPLLVEPAGQGRLTADVEGVTIMRDGARRYALVSSQGDNAFAVWRIDGPAPVYAGRFSVAASGGVDAVTGTDGLDALGGPVGPFPEGLVVVQDDVNDGQSQNFKLVDWRVIRSALKL